jgi:hypothetical protein
MRRRQLCNMHGGYRGSGVTIDWSTTPSQNVPIDKPIINPIKPEPEPFPTEPSTPTPHHKTNYANILGLVGLTGSIAAGAVGAYHLYSKASQPVENGIVDERQRVPLLRGTNPVGWRSNRKCFGITLSEAEQERWNEDDPEPELQLAPDPRQALKDRRQECEDAECLRGLSAIFDRGYERSVR